MPDIASLLNDTTVLKAAASAPKPKQTFVDQLAKASQANPFGKPLCFLDFEYNDDEVVCVHVILRAEDGTDKEWGWWFPKSPEAVEEFKLFVAELIAAGVIFVGFAVGIAEIVAMLRLGIDLKDSQWVDLFTEAKMIGQNHRFIGFWSLKLLDVAKTLGIPTPTDSNHKTRMRDLIIGGGPYSDSEEQSICDYCREDTLIMPDMLSRLYAIHEVSSAPNDLIFYLQRGAYILASALLNWRSKGLPVDVEFWNGIMAFRQEIRDTFARKCNEHYEQHHGVVFFTPDKKRSQSKFVLRRKLIADWAEANEIFWEKTRSGTPRLDHDYFDEQVRKVPILLKLKEAKDAMTALGAVNLAIDADGYVKPGSRTFHTITGRNQPMVKEGFIYNMAPVFRVAGTKPKPGMAMIAADWSKQEPAIAISLSGDQAYRAIFNQRDLYLACAIRAGAAPADATKKSHGIIRQAFKAAMLGIGYGMGFDTLSKKIYAEVNKGGAEVVMSMEEAQEKAANILKWHRSTFHVMWSYLHGRAADARGRGWITAEDGWLAYVNQHSKSTQLINFPIQANGAAMLRQAVISLCHETDLDVPFTLHDAIYVNCRIEDIEATQAIMRDHMQRAAQAILSDNPVPIAIEFKVITEDQPLDDERANALLPVVMETLEALVAREAEVRESLRAPDEGMFQ